MKKKCWGIFVMGNEVEQMKEIVENKYEVFEVRKLTFTEKLTYCKDPALFASEPWIIMFRSTRLQYLMLIRKLKLTPVM